MNPPDIKNIIEKAGLAGALIFTIYCFAVYAGNHSDHATQAMIQNTAAFVGLEKAIEKNDETIQQNFENNNRIIQQNTNVLRSLEQTILLKIK